MCPLKDASRRLRRNKQEAEKGKKNQDGREGKETWGVGGKKRAL